MGGICLVILWNYEVLWMQGNAYSGSAGSRSKIVFVNRFYWPDESATGQLLTDLAEHMARNGSDVTVVTSRLHYSAADEKLANSEQHNGVTILRVWTTAYNRSSMFGRLLDLVTFNVFAMLALIRILRSGDLVVAKTDPPFVQLFALVAAWLRRAKLVNWCQDLFPEVAYALMKPSHFPAYRHLLSAARNLALRRADYTVAISKEMRLTLLNQGIHRDRVLVINNWCDQQITPIPKEENTLRETWQLQDDFVIGYSGNLGRAHVPESIYRLIEELAGIPKLKMLFIGAGHGMTWLRQRCQDEGFGHVMFQPYQPRQDLSLSLSAPDIHLISLRSGCQKYIAPSKFYGILAAGRPIAFVGDLDSDMAKDIYRSRFGLTLSPSRVSDWRQSMLNLMQNADELSMMAKNARQAFEWRFAPSTSLDAWQRVLEKTTARAEFQHEKTVVTATQ